MSDGSTVSRIWRGAEFVILPLSQNEPPQGGVWRVIRPSFCFRPVNLQAIRDRPRSQR